MFVTKRAMALFEPDQFLKKPQKWLANQAGHMIAGFGIVLYVSLAGFGLFGEYPMKYNIWLIALLGYLAFEYIDQGWNGWDTVEDTVFVVGYGSSGTLLAISEVSVGSYRVDGDPLKLAIFSIVPLLHLFLGYQWRKSERDSS